MSEPQAIGLVGRMVGVTVALAASSAAVVLLAAVRTKLVAVELGPSGIGTLGLLTSLLTFGALVVELGIGTTAVKEVAASHERGDISERDEMRSALRTLTVVLAATGALLGLVLAPLIARLGLGDHHLTDEVRLTSLALFASVVAAASIAELSAFRRIRALALVNPLGALVATLATAVAYVSGLPLLPVALVAPSVALAIAATLWARSLPEPARGLGRDRLLRHSRRLVTLGSALVITGILAAVGGLLVRVVIDSELGRAATGQFQGAFAIAVLYVSFMFTALAMDYLPLLSGVVSDKRSFDGVVNTQLSVSLLIAAPLIAVLIATAPFLVPVLYSGGFSDTADVLRIMLLGEMLRVAGWTLGYILIVREVRAAFVTTEVVCNGVFVGGAMALVPSVGLQGAAIAYIGAQVVTFVLTLFFARRVSNFRLASINVAYLIGTAVLVTTVYCAAAIGGYALFAVWTLVAGSSYVSMVRLVRLGALDSIKQLHTDWAAAR